MFLQQKDTPWEGAVRSSAAIWSASLKGRQRASNQLIHISDWLPTFVAIAGGNITEPIDGHNVWDSLNYNTASPRTELLINLDDETPYSSLISGDWKLIEGTTSSGRYDDWLGAINQTERHPMFAMYGLSILQSPVGKALWPFSVSEDNHVEDLLSATEIERLRQDGRITCNNVPFSSSKLSLCNPLLKPCLFNITDDPCERQNLAQAHADIVLDLSRRVQEFREKSQPPRNRPADYRSNPASFNNTWTWWYDELGLIDEGQSTTTPIIPVTTQKSESSAFSDDTRPQIITVGILLLMKFIAYR